MKTRTSLDADEFAATYQSLEVARLNQVLKTNGISKAVRRKICEDYFFDQGVFLDDGWFQENGIRVGPVVAFATRDRDGDIKHLHLPDPKIGTMYHEYAHGAVAWLFDDKKEDASEIKVGQWAESD